MDSNNIVYQKWKLRQFNLVSDIVISPKRSLIINKKNKKSHYLGHYLEIC